MGVLCLKAQNTCFHAVVTKELEQKNGGVSILAKITSLLLICDGGFRNCEYEKGRDFVSVLCVLGGEGGSTHRPKQLEVPVCDWRGTKG